MLQPKLISVEPLENYRLLLSYQNGEKRIFNVKPYLSGSWYGKLKDEAYFKSVHIIDGGVGIEWSEGQDIAPHELYDNSVLYEGEAVC